MDETRTSAHLQRLEARVNALEDAVTAEQEQSLGTLEQLLRAVQSRDGAKR